MLGLEISYWERFTGPRNLRPGYVSWTEKSLLRKGFWENFSFWEKFHGQRNFCLVMVSGKSFLDCKSCSDCLGTKQKSHQNMQNVQNKETLPRTSKNWKLFLNGIYRNSGKYSPLQITYNCGNLNFQIAEILYSKETYPQTVLNFYNVCPGICFDVSMENQNNNIELRLDETEFNHKIKKF